MDSAPPSTSLIILGASTRAAAQSACRAGYAPWCIDLFADRDLRVIAPVQRCPAGGYPAAMLDMLDAAPPGPVLLTGKMEDYPDFLARLAARRPLLGHGVDAIAKARDPQTLASIKPLPPARRELIKPRRGFGIRLRKRDESPAPGPDHIIQPFVPGTPIAAVYHGPQLLGVTRQLLHRFAYRGSIGPIDADRTQLEQLGAQVSRRCGLTGLFGIDIIMDSRGELWPVEINPRYTASMEIVERAGETVMGKRIVFALADFVAPDLYELFDPDDVADVPAVGERIGKGQPICTVFARAATYAMCKEKLRERVGRLYTSVAS